MFRLELDFEKSKNGEEMNILLQYIIIITAGYGALSQLGILNGTFKGQQLLYYTILSNLMICAAYIFRNFCKKRKLYNASIYDNFQGAITLMIIITGLVYHFVLVPQQTHLASYEVDQFSNFLVHTFVPFLVFIDWVFFVKINDINILKPIYWLIIPLAYWFLSLMYSILKIPFAMTGRYYAYFFIDINYLGLNQVLINILICSIIFLLLGYLLKIIKYAANYYFS